ncbi:hypothetical protein F5879DRAFT_925992 [Lentinula edodes]|nr:hypothetical protein F5879DRAFT_925992 [Lentinula edodes]
MTRMKGKATMERWNDEVITYGEWFGDGWYHQSSCSPHSYRATVLLPETTLSLRAFYGYRNRRHRPRSHYALSSSTLLQLLTLLRYLSSPSSHLQLVYLLSMDPSSHLRNHLRNHQANSRIGVYYSTRNTTILGIFGIPSLPLRGYIPPPYWIVHAPYDDDGWCWLLRRSYGVLYLGISVVTSSSSTIAMSKTGQFSTMSDDQFRHVISQLPLSGRPTGAATTRATRGSSSSTPQPPPMLMLAPPSYVPQYPQGQQLPQTQTQMQQTQTQTRYQHYQIPPQTQQAPVAPIAPVVGTPISSSAQAYFTSYSSRLRTGATLLVQPTLFPGSTTTGSGTAAGSSSFPIPSTSSSSTLATTRPTRASRRSRGTVINYAEVDDEGDDDDGDGDGDDAKKDGDHIPDAGALDDDIMDGDFVAGNGNGRRVGRPSKQQQQQGRGDTSMDLDQSYLGQVPPARFIKSRGFLSNAATAQGGPMFSLDYGPNYLSSLPIPSTPPTHPIPNPILIPVRLEFDVPELGLRIRDVFLWNLHEPSSSGITPEVFASQFCRDLDIGVDPYGEIVARQIRAQVEDARGEAWVGWMDSLGFSGPVDDEDEDEEDLNQHQAKDSPTQNTECRVILSLDVQISTHHLTDHIEWDLLSPLTPEAFSLQLCADLGLSGEALPLIAHAVHEELCRHRCDVVDWGVLGAPHPPLNSNSNSIPGSIGDSEGPVKDRTGLGFGSAPPPGSVVVLILI